LTEGAVLTTRKEKLGNRLNIINLGYKLESEIALGNANAEQTQKSFGT